MKIDYSKQTLDTPNPIARFSHRKRYELSLGKVIKLLKKNQYLLDYGCGKGDFLNELSSIREDVKLLGFDPKSGHSSNKYIIVTNTEEIESTSIDVFCSFEVLEHLYKDEREMFYSEANRLLRDEGRLILSVPIIGGPTLLLKEINHIYLFKRKSEYSFKELLLSSFFGVPAERPENPRPTHKGFDFREIERDLKNKFVLEDKFFSPFPALPWYTNSQVFYVCSKHTHQH